MLTILWFRLLFSLFLPTFLCGALMPNPLLDLEDRAQPFVLETKKIEIPGYAHAFNPSLIRWKNFFLMSFRTIPDPKQSFTSFLGLIWLDENFCPLGAPQILELREKNSLVPPRAEDARLIEVGDRLFFIYSDNAESKVSRGGFRVYCAELLSEGGKFFLHHSECLSHFEGESRDIREKNWVPFNHERELLLAYSLLPHRIFRPILGTGTCETLCETSSSIDWDWGILRGGTPALLEKGEYLAFFHSSKELKTLHSEGKPITHYFMGAYTFSAKPPFAITRISPEPIVGKGFYHGACYKPYWKPAKVVFPCGLVIGERCLWVAYGRDDHEVWVAKLDKKKLLESLIPVQEILQP